MGGITLEDMTAAGALLDRVRVADTGSSAGLLARLGRIAGR